MTINPYESPHTLGAPAALRDDSCSGLWRSRGLLVMRIHGPRMPSRCLKTNEPYDGPLTPLCVSWLPKQAMWLILFGALGGYIARSVFGKSANLQLPVGESWRAQQRQRGWIGWGTVVAGIVILISATFGYIAAATSGVAEADSEWILWFVLASPLVSLVGLGYLFVFQRPLVTARNITPQHVWLDGVHPDFLATLPEWPG